MKRAAHWAKCASLTLTLKLTLTQTLALILFQVIKRAIDQMRATPPPTYQHSVSYRPGALPFAKSTVSKNRRHDDNKIFLFFANSCDTVVQWAWSHDHILMFRKVMAVSSTYLINSLYASIYLSILTFPSSKHLPNSSDTFSNLKSSLELASSPILLQRITNRQILCKETKGK